MRKILIVVDMQNDFIDGALGTAEALAIVENVKAKIREYDQKDIFVTMDTHAPDYLSTQEGRNLPVEHCIRGTGIKPLFQMLVYPFLDRRGVSESYCKYTDTPVWNSSLSKQVNDLINPHPEDTPLAYRSPVEAESLKGLPQAYIEVAEFDALRDDGILYSKLLQEAGIEVEFHDTHGTMHGFDYVTKAPTTLIMEELRIEYMKRKFRG